MKKVDKKLGLGLLLVFALAHIMPTLSMDEERLQRPLLQQAEGEGGDFVVDMSGVTLEDQQRLGALARLRRRGESARDWLKDKHYLKTIPGAGAVSWAATELVGGIPQIISVEQLGDQWAEWIGEKSEKYKRPALFLGGTAIAVGVGGFCFGFLVYLDLGYLYSPVYVTSASLAVASVKLAGRAFGVRKPMDNDDVENFLRSAKGQEVMRAEVGKLLEVRGIRDERPLGPFTLVDVVARCGSEEGSGGPSSDSTLGSSPRQLTAGVLAAARAAGEQVEEIGFDPGDGVRSPASLSEEDDG